MATSRRLSDEAPHHRKESTAREFDGSRCAAPDDVVVGHDMAIFAYKEAAALSDRIPSFVRHDYGDNRSIRFSGYGQYI